MSIRPFALAPLALLVLVPGCKIDHGFPWRLKRPTPKTAPPHARVHTVNPKYDRRTSRVMIRAIERPTRAQLDYAAYVANVMLGQPAPKTPLAPGQVGRVPPGNALFDGALDRSSIVAALAQTPLTPAERRAPLAFSPLTDYLAQCCGEQSAKLEAARAAVQGESWGLPKRPGLSYQQIATAYLHRTGKGLELWVKVEFQPWATVFLHLPDDDGDGYPSIYGRLAGTPLSARAIDQVRRDYIGRDLTSAEVRRWANELASYWYPSYNTDIVEIGSDLRWPDEQTEREITARLGDLVVEHPTAVIRGKPQGKAIYNVFVVRSLVAATVDAIALAGDSEHAPLKRFQVTAKLAPLRRRIADELERNGGSWKRWEQAVAPLRAAIAARLNRRFHTLKTIVGDDGFLFFRNALRFALAGDLQEQPAPKNPFPAIVAFKDYLANLRVDFLLVPVPTKVDIFPDKATKKRSVRPAGPPDQWPPLNPYYRKFLLELTEAGVEVVDLLPLYRRARAARKRREEPLYQKQDTHWTDRGLRLAARQIARRIRQYPWFAELKPGEGFKLKRTRFRHLGDLHSRLAYREQRRFRPMRLRAHQVLTPEGKLYEDDPNSPITVLGDSYTGVYQRINCRHAGVTAHLAYELSHAVDLVMSYGGGPSVRRKLLRRGEDALRQKRLLIWIFSARDLYDYWDDWEIIGGQGEQTK